MTPVSTPAAYSFVRNPIRFEFTTDSGVMRIFNIAFGTETFAISVHPYKIGPTTWKLSFDISDLLANLVCLKYDATLTHQINLPDFVNSYTVTEAVSAYSFIAKVISGGLSDDFITFLSQQETNPFDYRFLNPRSNWILTTRTDEDVITMSRNELTALFFLCPTDSPISIITEHSDELIISSSIGTACMINVPEWLDALTSGLVTKLYFKIDGETIIQIKITDKFNEESYLIKFKNSLGVYEFLEVTGKATESSQSGDESSYDRFNSVTNKLQKTRNRVPKNGVIEVETGYKSTSDLMFIDDLTSSDEITFINGNLAQECLVTSDRKNLLLKSTPESILLKIEFVNKSPYYSPFGKFNKNFLLKDDNGNQIVTDKNQNIYAL